MRLERVAVIGGGAWGTALAQAVASAGRQAMLVARDEQTVHEVNTQHTNARHLPGVRLSETIVGAHAAEADVYVLAVPAQQTRAALGRHRVRGPVVLAAKGLEHDSLLRQSEILMELAPEATPFVLSGPSFATDVAAGRPTAVTLAGDDAEETSELAAALAGPSFRPYAADDRVGVELAGALKNIYAIGAGAVEGALLGASARSALIARAFAEMSRLVVAMGGSASTLAGLAGLGDLALSCTSPQSRNYRYGLALGQGRIPDVGLAEGVATAPVAKALAVRYEVDAPLCEAVNLLLAGASSIDTIVSGLMSRPLRRED